MILPEKNPYLVQIFHSSSQTVIHSEVCMSFISLNTNA